MGLQVAGRCGLEARVDACRLVIRREKGLTEIVKFVIAGLEVGQQVVVMAGPTWLKDVAAILGEGGLRPGALLRSGKLVFLTAPTCLEEMFKSGDPFQRGPLHRHASVMRWVTDWSWAYGDASDLEIIRNYQRRVHAFVRPLNAISMCTVQRERLGRTSLLAMLVDHRQANRPMEMLTRTAHA
jgi:DcmR-like sensory protein